MPRAFPAFSKFLVVSMFFAAMICVLVVGSAQAVGQQYASLYSFQGNADGWNPIGFLIYDSAGNLYGTTTYGGTGTACDPYGCGTVFELQPPANPGDPWVKTVLHNFNGSDGYWPSTGRMAVDKSGNLYGATQFGGTGGFGYGVVFQLSPGPGGNWTENVLYNFADGDDGGVPANGLTMDASGNLYGTTNDGGAFGQNGAGTIFEISPPAVKGGAWKQTTLYSLEQIKDGNEPNDVTLDAKGNLYGTRSADNILCTPGSPRFCGTAFELERVGATWHLKVLHHFQGSSDGSSPWSSMVLDGEGNLYGTTLGFGGNITTAGGTVFELSPPAVGTGPWTETLLYTFSGGADGGQPLSDLVFDSKGNLYDTTFYGGDLSCNVGVGCGVVFSLMRPSQSGLPWTESVLHTFVGGSDGQNPFAGLRWGAGGVLYGTASEGGGSPNCNGGCGTVFSVLP